MDQQSNLPAGAEQAAADTTPKEKLQQLLADARSVTGDTLHVPDVARGVASLVDALDLVVAELRKAGAPL